MTFRLLVWSLITFFAFALIALLAVVADIVMHWRARRRAAKLFAMDPVRPLRRDPGKADR